MKEANTSLSPLERTQAVAGHAGDDTAALLPRKVRRLVLGVVGAVLLATTYLVAVRGQAILFDLRDAVSAFCF